MHVVKGGCHCGNISYVAEFPKELNSYTPRVCDCRLCNSHGAAYVSDKNGKLLIKIKNEREVSRYRQGSRIADFLICKNCGVMSGVIYKEDSCVYGSINIQTFDKCSSFNDGKEMHITQLNDEDRIKRWKDNWFSCVIIEHKSA